jgi:hypothetical protein
MTIDEAVADLIERIGEVSPEAAVRVTRVSDSEAVIRAYAAADNESAITEATEDVVLALLTGEGLDVQVLVYDIVTSPPPQDR